MMVVGAVVLNYNTGKITKTLAEELASMDILSKIVVVDNCSSDDSLCELETIENSKVTLVQAEKNAGYAVGNNIGIRMLMSECEYIFVVNPDVIIKEECFVKMVDVLKNNSDIGIVGCVRTDIDGNYTQRQCWKLPTYRTELMECFGLYRKRNRKKQKYKCEEENFEYVEVAPGSLWGASAQILKQMDGLDENTFLYYEENILAQKMKKMGKKEAIVTSSSYIHNHVDRKKKPKEMADIYSVLNRSRRYYQNNYMHINLMQKGILRVCMAWGKGEMYLLQLLRRSR